MNLIVTLDNPKHSKSLISKIKQLEHVKTVAEDLTEQDDEIFQLLEERWNDYKSNTTKSSNWADVKADIIKKHGF